MFRTYQPKQAEIKRDWHLIDVKGKVLGRTATEIARLLMGKHKRNYAPHLDMGDYVVVINAEETRVTGKKEKQKIYWRHSGYPGGLKATRLEELREKNPTRIIELAVKRMLPTNRLRDKRMGRLKVFTGSEHPYGDKIK